MLAFRRVTNVFSTGRISLRGVRRSPSNMDSTSASKEGFTITNNITRTIMSIVGQSRPRRRVGITGTRKLGRYHRLLGLTALNGCPNCLLRNVTYPNKYITKTKAVRTVGGSRATINLCTGGTGRRFSDRARCVGRLSGLISWVSTVWGDSTLSGVSGARDFLSILLLCPGPNVRNPFPLSGKEYMSTNSYGVVIGRGSTTYEVGPPMPAISVLVRGHTTAMAMLITYESLGHSFHVSAGVFRVVFCHFR